jgi:TolA-binding protein
MDDFDDELRDIKREIIESRGLIIKTNNLTNALASDIKSIGKRQQSFERRAFWNSAAVNLLFSVGVVLVVKFAWDARVESVERETRRTRARLEEAAAELGKVQKRIEARAKGESAALAFYELMRGGKKKELIEAYDSLQKKYLTRAEREIFRHATQRARGQLSVKSYHAGRASAQSGRWQEAVVALEDSLRYDDNAAHAPSATLLLARSYRRLKRQRDAIPLLVKLSEASADSAVLDDAMFLLATCLSDIQAYNDAVTTLRKFIRRYPRSPYANDAKMLLADLRVKR